VTITISENEARWLGGFLRGFCSDEIYELEGEELEARFRLLLELEMNRERDDMDFTPRQELEICMQVGDEIAATQERGEYYPGYGTVEDEAEKEAVQS
jgi:hypothetical protein